MQSDSERNRGLFPVYGAAAGPTPEISSWRSSSHGGCSLLLNVSPNVLHQMMKRLWSGFLTGPFRRSAVDRSISQRDKMVVLCNPLILYPIFPSERSWAYYLNDPLAATHWCPFCLLLAELWMEFFNSHHLEHHRVCVYCWRIMHPPVTLPQVNVQSVVLLQNYPAGHLILVIWLNFSFNYPVLCRAIEDSHKGPLLLMWTICFLSKMPTFPKPPTAPWASSHGFQGCVTLCKHTAKPQRAWRYSKCPFYSRWSTVINPNRN